MRAAVDGAGRTLSLTVEDTGAGTSGRVGSSGVGLQNVAERLKGHYGDEASLAFESGPGRGARVVLRLPVTPRAQLAAVAAAER